MAPRVVQALSAAIVARLALLVAPQWLNRGLPLLDSQLILRASELFLWRHHV